MTSRARGAASRSGAAGRMRRPDARLALCCRIAARALAALGCSLSVPPARAPPKSSIHFESDVKLAKDGEMTVTETMRVQRGGRRDPARHLPRFPAHLRRRRRHAARGHFQPPWRHAATARPEPYHTERQRGVHAHLCRRQGRRSLRAASTLTFSATAPPPDPLVRRQAGTQLERHRQFLALPDPGRELPAAICRRRAAGALDRLYRAGGRARHQLARRIGALGALTVATTRPLAPARASPSLRKSRPARSTPPQAHDAVGTESSTTARWIFGGVGFAARVRLLPRGLDTRSAAIPKAAPSFRCFIRRAAFRRRSPITSTTGASGARNGAPSRRRRCRWRCAALSASTTGRRHADAEATGRRARRRRDAARRRARDLHLGERAWRHVRRIDTAHGEAVRQGRRPDSPPSIEAESRNRFFRRNLGYVIAGVAHDGRRGFRR